VFSIVSLGLLNRSILARRSEFSAEAYGPGYPGTRYRRIL
jgi:hypothetical protein